VNKYGDPRLRGSRPLCRESRLDRLEREHDVIGFAHSNTNPPLSVRSLRLGPPSVPHGRHWPITTGAGRSQRTFARPGFFPQTRGKYSLANVFVYTEDIQLGTPCLKHDRDSCYCVSGLRQPAGRDARDGFAPGGGARLNETQVIHYPERLARLLPTYEPDDGPNGARTGANLKLAAAAAEIGQVLAHFDDRR